jgi:hypothetical protein
MAQLDQSTIKLILRDFFTGEWSKLRSTLPTEADGEMAVEEQLYGASGGEEVVRGWIAGKSYPRYLEDNAKQILASAGIDADDVSADDMNAVCEGIARAWLDIEDMRCELLEGHPEKAIPQDPLYKGLTDPLIPTLQSCCTRATAFRRTGA